MTVFVATDSGKNLNVCRHVTHMMDRSYGGSEPWIMAAKLLPLWCQLFMELYRVDIPNGPDQSLLGPLYGSAADEVSACSFWTNNVVLSLIIIKAWIKDMRGCNGITINHSFWQPGISWHNALLASYGLTFFHLGVDAVCHELHLESVLVIFLW